MGDASTSATIRQARPFTPAVWTLALWVGLAAAFTGCTQAEQGRHLAVAEDHVRIPSFAPIVQAVMPAVVHVSAIQMTTKTTSSEEEAASLKRARQQDEDRGLPPAAVDELLRRFFGMPELPVRSTGSGFIIDPAGYVVTEDHVVENASDVTVTLQDGKRQSARIVGRDPKTDLALLKIKVDRPLSYVDWGDSDTTQVGDWVVAIGNPFGLDSTVSSGIISGRGRNIHLGSYDDFLQIDAAINLGNSGGPTFDLSGRVIGINTAIYSPNTGSVGIGFAVPANLAKPVIEQLKSRGRVERGWLGVRTQEVTPELAGSFGLPKATGVLVADIPANGPAAYAGFATGDIILSVNGQIIGKKRALLLALAALPVGQEAEVRVWRQRAEIVLHPLIGEMPGSPEQTMAEASGASRTQRRDFVIGLNLAPLTEARRELLGIPTKIRGAIVVSVDDESVLLGTGIRPGDVIENVNQIPVTSPAEALSRLKQALGSGGKNVLMLINRQGTNRYVAMSLGDKPNGDDDI